MFNKHLCAKTWLSMTASLALLSACASPKVATVIQTQDQHMNCQQLIAENAEMERLFAEANAEKGMTGGNVLRFLFFWPAIIGTHMNANEAINAARQRQVHLNHLMAQRGCFKDNPNHPAAARAPMPTPQANAPTMPRPRTPQAAPKDPYAYNPYIY